MLSSMIKTVQMGQIGIRSVQDTPMCQELQDALDSQLREYDAIETEAHNIANERGWKLKELNPAVRAMSEMMSRMQLMGGNYDSKIAGMMIQGNTRGVITGMKNARQHQNKDGRVTALCEKLLETEDRNIDQMKPFL
jgi:uncharacterized protein (DUF305 family)